MNARFVLLVDLGAAVGTMGWFVIALGFGYGIESVSLSLSLAAALVSIGAYTGGIVWLLLYGFPKGETLSRASRMDLVKLSFPFLGLSFTIIGVAVSFVCNSTPCIDYPYRSIGLILVLVGAILVLASLVLFSVVRHGGPGNPETPG